MTTAEWISVIALIIATGGFAINLYNWLKSGPKLHLSLMADAISIPDDGRGPHMALIVINRGTIPTMLTHLVLYGFASRWAKWRFRSKFSAVVNAPNIPFELGVNKTWIGIALHEGEVVSLRAAGELYVGVISAHSKKNFLIKVPPKAEGKTPKKVVKG